MTTRLATEFEAPRCRSVPLTVPGVPKEFVSL
jgi:hypothetical protein